MTAMPPAKRLTGLNPLSYMGVEPLSPLEFVIERRDPTQNDNRFNIGTIWLHADQQDPWMLVNLNQNVATWLRLGAAVSVLESLTGNTGGPVFPDVSQNIDVVADVTSGLTVTGNPGTNTLTIFTQSGNPTLQSLTGDVGAAAVTDANENIDILGGSNINTETPGGGSEVFVNLNNVIRWEDTDVGGTQGVIYMNAASPGVGGQRFFHNKGTESVFLGDLAGNFSTTGSFNIGIGSTSLQSVSSGVQNISIGSNSQALIATGNRNISIGSSSLSNEVDGEDNISIGDFSLSNLGSGITGGSYNIALGVQAGTNYTDNESSNIIIGNAGVAAEFNTIRIGNQGNGSFQQNRAFMAGITGVAVANAASVQIDTTTGQLGVGGGGGGHAGDNAFLAYVETNFTMPELLGPGSDQYFYQLGTSGMAAMVESYDVDSVFFPGDGTNPVSFTAPADGIYTILWSSNCQFIRGAIPPITKGRLYQTSLVINGDTNNAFFFRSPSWYENFGSGANNITDSVGNVVTHNLQLNAADVVTFYIGGFQLKGSSVVDQTFIVGKFISGAAYETSGWSNWIMGYRIF